MEALAASRPATLALLVLLILWIPLRARSDKYNPPVYDPKGMSERYKSWLERHGRTYKSKGEWEMRFGIYQFNVQLIDYINSQNLSFKLTDNMFADLTNGEFKATYLGYRPLWHAKTNFSYGKDVDLPTSVDWRNKGAVTPIKNQGPCGRNFYFSSMETLTSSD